MLLCLLCVALLPKLKISNPTGRTTHQGNPGNKMKTHVTFSVSCQVQVDKLDNLDERLLVVGRLSCVLSPHTIKLTTNFHLFACSEFSEKKTKKKIWGKNFFFGGNLATWQLAGKQTNHRVHTANINFPHVKVRPNHCRSSFYFC